MREVYVWSRLQHVNVQELLGIIHFQEALGMVSPWMENGNLQEYIASDRKVERYPLVGSIYHLYSPLLTKGSVSNWLRGCRTSIASTW